MTTTPSPATIRVTDNRQLSRLWSELLGTGPASTRTLWLAWLRPDGTVIPTLVPVEQLPEAPMPAGLRGVAELHASIAEQEHLEPDQLHLTIALERRGRNSAALAELDDEWCEAVEGDLVPSLEQCCSFHVFDGRSVVQLIPRASWSR
jgi:hypothetical protein